MLSELCVWYLRMRKRSVIMNFNITNGNLQPKENKVYLYDNELNVDSYFDVDGEKMCLPKGKFTLTTYGSDE